MGALVLAAIVVLASVSVFLIRYLRVNDASTLTWQDLRRDHTLIAVLLLGVAAFATLLFVGK